MSAKLKGSISLDEANITPIEHITGKENSFGIFKAKIAPTYLLAATSQEMKQWISVLEKIAKPSNTSTSSGFLDSIEAMLDPTIVANGKAIICGFNSAAEKLFGYRKEEVIGQNLTILMPPPYCDIHHNFIANYKKTGQRKLIGLARKLPAKRKDGSIISMELSLGEAPLPKGQIITEEQKQNIPRWIAIAREMTFEEDEDTADDISEISDDGNGIPEACPISGRSGSCPIKSTSSVNSDKSNPSSNNELSAQVQILRSEVQRLMESVAILTKERDLLAYELKEYKSGDDTNLEKLLKDDSGYNAFLSFCMFERTEENVMFWKFVEDYKNTIYVQELTDKAIFIYETYIKDGCPRPLNIDVVRREHIKQGLNEPTREMFSPLQRYITMV